MQNKSVPDTKTVLTLRRGVHGVCVQVLCPTTVGERFPKAASERREEKGQHLPFPSLFTKTTGEQPEEA